MIEAIGEVTEEGIRLPRQVLKDCGYEPGRRMTVTKSEAGLLIRPAQATAEEIKKRSLCYLLREAGDMTAVRIPEWDGGRWRVAVFLMPDALPIGQLAFSPEGELISEESSSVRRMIEAAGAA